MTTQQALISDAERISKIRDAFTKKLELDPFNAFPLAMALREIDRFVDRSQPGQEKEFRDVFIWRLEHAESLI